MAWLTHVFIADLHSNWRKRRRRLQRKAKRPDKASQAVRVLLFGSGFAELSPAISKMRRIFMTQEKTRRGKPLPLFAFNSQESENLIQQVREKRRCCWILIEEMNDITEQIAEQITPGGTQTHYTSYPIPPDSVTTVAAAAKLPTVITLGPLLTCLPARMLGA